MTKPRRELAAARQLGVINNILKPQSQAPRFSWPSRRLEEAEDSREHMKTNSVDSGRSRSSQQSSRGDQRTSHQQSQRRSFSLQQSPRPRSNPEHNQNNQQRSHSPRIEQRDGPGRVQSRASKPGAEPRGSNTRSKPRIEGAHNNQLSSGKRKRLTKDDSNDSDRAQAIKKQRVCHPNFERPKPPLPRARIDQKSIVLKTAAITATPIVKNQSQSESKMLTHLPAPPIGNGTPERESHNKGLPDTSCVSTPTPVEKARSEPSSLLSIDAESGKSMKRQRDGDINIDEAPKRLRQMKAVKPLRPARMSPTEPLQTLQQTHPSSHVRAQAVRPESSFAPVTPNHECELKFLDYLHDSVPVLYSSMINHSFDAGFLNNPSGTLVVDALAIIGPSVDPHAKRSWPSAIELLGCTPSMNIPARVLSDVDLYIHKKEDELYVATDRGLVIVTDYLKLVGVPETQPVRFEGHVPSWARATFRTPKKRRIVQAKGKDEIVAKDAAPGIHQLALTLQTHVEVEEERINLREWEEQAKADAEAEKASPMRAKASNIGTERSKISKDKRGEPGFGETKVLSADPGHLPLRAGSIVLVYAIDDEDEWAYGRLSGTDKMGRFPIAYTCPTDWSLDKFARTDNGLNERLNESEDPEERDWRGPFHWLRQKGYPFGPTWEETLAAGAARARVDKERNVSANKTRVSNAKFIAEVVDVRAGWSASCGASSDKPSSILTRVATAATGLLTASMTLTTTESDIEGANARSSSPSINEGAENSGIGGYKAGTRADCAHPVKDFPKAGIVTATMLETDQVEGVVAATTLPRVEKQEVASTNAGQELEGDEPDGEKAAASVEDVEVPVPPDPFTVPQYDPFVRNDDIEYDWGDSDEEL